MQWRFRSYSTLEFLNALLMILRSGTSATFVHHIMQRTCNRLIGINQFRENVRKILYKLGWCIFVYFFSEFNIVLVGPDDSPDQRKYHEDLHMESEEVGQFVQDYMSLTDNLYTFLRTDGASTFSKGGF